MAYTVREWLHFVYWLIWQVGATAQLNANSFLMYTNSALNMVYNYQWYIWTRQHYKDVFNLSSEDWTEYKTLTREPVAKIDKFYVFNWQDVENPVQPATTWTPTDCWDCENLPWITCYETNCCYNDPPCKSLDLFENLPHNELCANQYAVTWSEIKGMGWYEWRIIHVKLKYPTSGLWVTYYRGVRHMKTFEDILPIPDAFITPRAYYVAWHITPLYGIMAQQQDLNFMSIARKELDSLKMADNIFHENIVFDPSYPLEPKTNKF